MVYRHNRRRWIVDRIGAGIHAFDERRYTARENVYKEFAPAVSDRHIVRLAKFLVPIIALIAVYFTLNGGETMSALILMGYSLITQLFPSLLFSLKRNNPINKFGAIAGIITGLAIVICITLSQSTIGTLFPSLPQAAKDLNVESLHWQSISL